MAKQHRDDSGRERERQADRRADEPSFANTNIFDTEREQTADRRHAADPIDETGEATTAAVPERHLEGDAGDASRGEDPSQRKRGR